MGQSTLSSLPVTSQTKIWKHWYNNTNVMVTATVQELRDLYSIYYDVLNFIYTRKTISIYCTI